MGMEASEPVTELLSLAWQGLCQPGHAFHTVGTTCGIVILLTYVVSTSSGNYSQVDKLWSITPFVYAWQLAIDRRTTLMAVVSTVWGLRLTYNFYRRGGYTWPPWQGDEDYRWKVVQSWKIFQAPLVWHVFNFGFISFYQNILLLLIASPSLVVHLLVESSTVPRPSSSLHLGDALVATLVLLLVAVETVADNQQYAFQTEKYRRRALKQSGKKRDSVADDSYAQGFLQSGLFAIVRKPNYAAEQAIWISYSFFIVTALSSSSSALRDVLTLWLLGSVGWILLVLLFASSGPLTERITCSKYPSYKDYQQRVPLYVPRLFPNKAKTH